MEGDLLPLDYTQENRQKHHLNSVANSLAWECDFLSCSLPSIPHITSGKGNCGVFTDGPQGLGFFLVVLLHTSNATSNQLQLSL